MRPPSNETFAPRSGEVPIPERGGLSSDFDSHWSRNSRHPTRLPTLDYRLSTTDSRLTTNDFRLSTFDCLFSRLQSRSFHELDATSEWLLVRADAPVARDGLVGGRAEIWSESGRLLASGGQQMLCRPMPRRMD